MTNKSEFQRRRDVVEYLGVRIEDFTKYVQSLRAATSHEIVSVEFAEEFYENFVAFCDRFKPADSMEPKA